jgi:hypothetical protein
MYTTTMSHTIYAAKFEQTIIHQHVHLRRVSQSHAAAHVLMRLYPIDKSLVCSQSERRTSCFIGRRLGYHERVSGYLIQIHYIIVK